MSTVKIKNKRAWLWKPGMALRNENAHSAAHYLIRTSDSWSYTGKHAIPGEGWSQRSWIDYYGVYYPVVRYPTIRYLLTLAVMHNLVIKTGWPCYRCEAFGFQRECTGSKKRAECETGGCIKRWGSTDWSNPKLSHCTTICFVLAYILMITSLTKWSWSAVSSRYSTIASKLRTSAKRFYARDHGPLRTMVLSWWFVSRITTHTYSTVLLQQTAELILFIS